MNTSYTKMPNKHLRDPCLSLKAKGLMSLLLSLPPNWDLSVGGLVAINADGRDSISATLKELEKHGYLSKENTREKGKFAKTVISINPDLTVFRTSETTENNNNDKTKPNAEQITAFERWWSLYPKKQEKTRSQKSYIKALKNVGEQVLLDGLDKYIGYLQSRNVELRYTKLASTWLNGKCWQDEYDTTRQSISTSGLPVSNQNVDF